MPLKKKKPRVFILIVKIEGAAATDAPMKKKLKLLMLVLKVEGELYSLLE